MKYSFLSKYNIYLIICVIVIFIVISYCIFYNPNIDSFKDSSNSSNISDTDFLAPSTDTISDMMWSILGNKMNKVNDTTDFTLEKIKDLYTNFITKEEINYYLENNNFPWSSYVASRYKELLPNKTNEQPYSPDEQLIQMMKYYPNRYAYRQYLLSPDMKESIESVYYLTYSGEKFPTPTPTPTATTMSIS